MWIEYVEGFCAAILLLVFLGLMFYFLFQMAEDIGSVWRGRQHRREIGGSSGAKR